MKRSERRGKYCYALVGLKPYLEAESLAYYINKSIGQTFGITGAIQFDVLGVARPEQDSDEGNAVIRTSSQDSKVLLGAIATFASSSISLRLIKSTTTWDELGSEARGITDLPGDDSD